eukprot:2459696-Rhodomonas_salina.3
MSSPPPRAMVMDDGEGSAKKSGGDDSGKKGGGSSGAAGGFEPPKRCERSPPSDPILPPEVEWTRFSHVRSVNSASLHISLSYASMWVLMTTVERGEGVDGAMPGRGQMQASEEGRTAILAQTKLNAQRRPHQVPLAFNLANLAFRFWITLVANPNPELVSYLTQCGSASLFGVGGTPGPAAKRPKGGGEGKGSEGKAEGGEEEPGSPTSQGGGKEGGEEGEEGKESFEAGFDGRRPRRWERRLVPVKLIGGEELMVYRWVTDTTRQ